MMNLQEQNSSLVYLRGSLLCFIPSNNKNCCVKKKKSHNSHTQTEGITYKLYNPLDVLLDRSSEFQLDFRLLCLPPLDPLFIPRWYLGKVVPLAGANTFWIWSIFEKSVLTHSHFPEHQKSILLFPHQPQAP